MRCLQSSFRPSHCRSSFCNLTIRFTEFLYLFYVGYWEVSCFYCVIHVLSGHWLKIMLFRYFQMWDVLHRVPMVDFLELVHFVLLNVLSTREQWMSSTKSSDRYIANVNRKKKFIGLLMPVHVYNHSQYGQHLWIWLFQEGFARLWRGTNAGLALAIPTVSFFTLPCLEVRALFFRVLFYDERNLQ